MCAHTYLCFVIVIICILIQYINVKILKNVVKHSE